MPALEDTDGRRVPEVGICREFASLLSGTVLVAQVADLFESDVFSFALPSRCSSPMRCPQHAVSQTVAGGLNSRCNMPVSRPGRAAGEKIPDALYLEVGLRALRMGQTQRSMVEGRQK